MTATALLRLAERIGVETRYTDALGKTREASEDALRALFAAFGLPPDPGEASLLLDERKQSAPLGIGNVHIVAAEDRHPRLTMCPPAGAREILWRCRLEDGAEQRGRFAAEAATVVMPLPAALPLGYHRLAVSAGAVETEIDLIVAPNQCHLPAQLAEHQRSWGLTCQLYALRSERDWGMGDYTDLAQMAAVAGSCGAAVLGINPLHARFAAEPLHFSPYSPSSRSWLDYLYIDPTEVAGFAADTAAQTLMNGEWFGATRWAARSAPLVDYGAVAACKRAVLEALFRRFGSVDLGGPGQARTSLGRSFRRFTEHSGQSLADLAVFEALHEHFRRAGSGFSWRSWPAPMRHPRSPEVAEFAAANREQVEFFQFLQWEADRQLTAAAAAGRAAGLSIGLYRDLAVGADPNGADAWADQELVAPHISIGAPPDALSRAGQNWGLAPIVPAALRRQGFAPFIACLRANMGHAGILRIDHVMSLSRLYWIPSGMAATEGAYVNYPFGDLLRLVALESHRNACAVVGEDLGTVPSGFRDTMRAANILSYRVMMFERRADGGFIPPGEYPPLAAAAAATHDLATIAGFWLGRDIDWRRRLGLYPDDDAETAEATGRDRDRGLLLDALIAAGLIAGESRGEFFSENGESVFRPSLGDAIQRYLARSRARLMLVQIEDVIGEAEQANLPGTTEAHPNWRRRLSRTIAEIADGGDLRRVAALVDEERRDAQAG